MHLSLRARARMPVTLDGFHKVDIWDEEDAACGGDRDMHDMCTAERQTMVNSKQFSHVIGSSGIIVTLWWLMKP